MESCEAFGRLELTFHRPALRRLGVRREADLVTAEWATIAARFGRFCEIDTRPARLDPVAIKLRRSAVIWKGFETELAGKSPAYRRWINGRLRPLPVQRNLEAAFRRLNEAV